jgi:hypothetical protein
MKTLQLDEAERSAPLEDKMRETGTRAFERVLSHLSKLPVPITQMALEELVSAFDEDETSLDDVNRRTTEIQSTLRREMTTISLYSVDLVHADLLKEKKPGEESEFPFGDDVAAKFPDSVDDIIEAGKCLALRRNTASVFHLMRSMESALITLGEQTGITYLNKHGEPLPWGIIVSNLRDAIDDMSPGKRKDEWAGVQAMLFSVNRAFRTKTAHPERVYSDEQAERAYTSVKSFLQEMALLV